MPQIVSIIIPFYNVEQFVLECLESVIDQTFADIELVLIDDCCTDRTVDVAKGYLDTQKNVNYKIVHHSKNLGLSAARNTGLDNATGDYLYFLDSDDILEPTAIENLFKAITSGDYAIAISYFTRYADGVKDVYRYDWLFEEPRIIAPEEFADRMLTEKGNFASTAKLYRKEILQEIRFRLGKRNEDTLFIVDLIPIIEKNKYKCIDIPDYSYNYRMREGSICHNTHRPLGLDVINNYEEAIRVCSGKATTIEWLRQQQLNIAFQLTLLFMNSLCFDSSLFHEVCRFYKKVSNSYVKTTRTDAEYKSFIEYKYIPHFYKWYYRKRRGIC